MLIRRNLAIAFGALTLCLPLASACGFEPHTNMPYTVAVGADSYDGPVDVLGAVVVSSAPGAGTFIASMANNDVGAAASFDSLAPGSDPSFEAGEFTPVEIAARGSVNLADEGGVPITGDFAPGDVVPVTVGFGSGERVQLSVPVVGDDGYYEGLDSSTASPEDTASTDTGSE